MDSGDQGVRSGQLRLTRARDVASVLGSFFRRHTAPGSRVELSQGLWPLLEWCWSVSPDERESSALCRALIAEPGYGWRDESDVVDAIARRTAGRDPSRLEPRAAEGLLRALLAEGENARGRRARLELHLDFILPRIDRHPALSLDTIRRVLQEDGLPGDNLAEHLIAVHPERRPYQGTWVVVLHDRLRAVPPNAESSRKDIRWFPVQDAEVGRRSRIAVGLSHAPDFAAYFGLSLTSLPGRGPGAASVPQEMPL